MGAAPNFPAANDSKATALHFANRALQSYVFNEPVVAAHVVKAAQVGVD